MNRLKINESINQDDLLQVEMPNMIDSRKYLIFKSLKKAQQKLDDLPQLLENLTDDLYITCCLIINTANYAEQMLEKKYTLSEQTEEDSPEYNILDADYLWNTDLVQEDPNYDIIKTLYQKVRQFMLDNEQLYQSSRFKNNLRRFK